MFSVGIVAAAPVLSAGFDLPNASQFASPRGMANYGRFVSGRYIPDVLNVLLGLQLHRLS